MDTDVLCACGCGLPVPKVGNIVKKFRQGHWVRTQGSGSEFQKAHAKDMEGRNNPQYGKFGKDHPSYGHETTQETRELRRKTILRTLSQGKMGKTDIEVILSEILDELKVKHMPQSLLYDKFTVDEYLPDFGVVIEAFGAYWHGDRRVFKKMNRFQVVNSKRDASRGAWLTKKGHRVLILWERELKKDREWCKREVMLAIENALIPYVQDSV
jgi:very-short-patch-repair endonuclease